MRFNFGLKRTLLVWLALAMFTPVAAMEPSPALKTNAPTNANEAAGKAAAEEAFRELRTGRCAAGIEAESKRIQRDLFQEVLREYGNQEKSAPELKEKEEKLYLFISSSMPKETLRNYVADIAAMQSPKVVMVLRGFVGGMKKILPTRDFVLDVLKKEPNCDFDSGEECEFYSEGVIIDPMLFRKFGVEVVPTLVLESADGGARSISGDAELEYLLERLKPNQAPMVEKN